MEPRTYVACSGDGKFEIKDEPLSAFGAMVAKPLADASFLCANAAVENSLVIWRSPHGTGELESAPLDPRLLERFDIGALLSWTLRGETIEGRLFALDKTEMTV